MDTYLLQDWLSLSSNAAGNVITQSEGRWLDLAAYRDVVAWLDVKQVSSGSVAIGYQSAIAKEETLFATMATSTRLLSPGVSTVPMLYELQAMSRAAPLARWVRWQASLNAGDSITFRIWIAANKPGRASLNRAAVRR